MTRRRISTRLRISIFTDAAGLCHICGRPIDGTRERWEVEHIIPLALGGADDAGNMRPAHTRCHRSKTTEDVGRLAKAKRQEARHLGAKKARAVIPGSKASQWKRKLDGTVVPR